jgi:hypothetical protein
MSSGMVNTFAHTCHLGWRTLLKCNKTNHACTHTTGEETAAQVHTEETQSGGGLLAEETYDDGVAEVEEVDATQDNAENAGEDDEEDDDEDE